ncbi:MFS transporter [Nocardioides sp. 1609]|uniref:MFS transporter n=1 Tax=Nocardioides sp. 1609 TaxID=2508327 RepID=UPI00106FEF30|nr:MFS transporter [Nocardioides sp. 1609]
MTGTASPSSAATAVDADPASRTRRKAILAGSVGNAVEFVDWAVYSTFSSVFAHHFFPPGNDVAALLGTLAIFAVGFVIRPVGAAVMGVYADRVGRRRVLIVTITMMAAATFAIGVAPTYEQVGVVAPIVLVLARLVQGFAAGGEFGSASAFLVESGHARGRAFAGSWQQVSVSVGILVAAGMGAILTAVLPADALDAWGWRLAFVVAASLGLVGLWLRRNLEETESFRAGQERTKRQDRRGNALWSMVCHHPRAVARVIGLNIGGVVLYNIWIIYLPTYASITTDLTLSHALVANVVALVLFIVLLPLGGMLSDRIGRKPTMSAFAGGFVLFSWPAFQILDGSLASFYLVQIVGIVLLVGYCANVAAVMAEQFPPEVRATGIGVPYALAVAIFGGTAPYLTTWLSSSGREDWVWIYCTGAALVALAVYLTMPETRSADIDATDGQ